MENCPRHQCIIYDGAPSHKLSTLATVMARMMKDGYRCLYLNSPAMVAGMRSSLAAMGIDIAMETTSGRLVFSSETVAEDEDFNVERMLQMLEDALDEALKDGYKGLWASGDMTWELGSEKNFKKLVEYEWKLEALFQKRKELHGICQYHNDTLPPDVIRSGLLMHPSVFINETLSRLNPFYDSRLELPSATKTDNPLLHKMIAELCQPNVNRDVR